MTTTVRWLGVVCVAFVVLGAVLPWAYETAVFAMYRDALEAALGDPGEALAPARTLLFGITGGSIVGKWIAHLALVEAFVRTRSEWAWRANIVGLVSWFALDSIVSIAHGAWWNLAYVNTVPLFVFGGLLVRARREIVDHADPPEPSATRRPIALARIAMGAGAVSGLVIAFGGTTALFGPWRTAFEVLVSPTDRAAALHLFATLLGPIGGTTFAHFVMLALLLRHDRAPRRAIAWAAASIIAWAVVDSTWSLLAGGAFNVAMVNAPACAMTLLPLVWAWRNGD